MPRGPRGDTRPDRDIGQTLHVRLPKTAKAYSEKLTTWERCLIAKNGG